MLPNKRIWTAHSHRESEITRRINCRTHCLRCSSRSTARQASPKKVFQAPGLVLWARAAEQMRWDPSNKHRRYTNAETPLLTEFRAHLRATI